MASMDALPQILCNINPWLVLYERFDRGGKPGSHRGCAAFIKFNLKEVHTALGERVFNMMNDAVSDFMTI